MKSRLFSWIMFLIPAIILGGAVALLVSVSGSDEPEVLVGMVECTEIDVVSKIPGRVATVLVEEGTRVTPGQVVATLDSKEIDAKAAQARGAVQAADARLAMARKGARPEEKEAVRRLYEQARHQFELAEKTFNRVQSVFDEGLIAEQERDQARFKYDAAREQMAAAGAQLRMVDNGARAEDILAAEGLVLQAKSAEQEAIAYRSETLLRSPIAGEVAERVIDPGEIAAAGYPVLTLIVPENAWVVLQVREDRLASFQVGTTVAGVVPALGGKRVAFRVSRVAPMADFATWRATNQKGDFDLKTFEVHLRPVRTLVGLRPGMSVQIPLATSSDARK